MRSFGRDYENTAIKNKFYVKKDKVHEKGHCSDQWTSNKKTSTKY